MKNNFKNTIALSVFLFGIISLAFGGDCFAKEKNGLNERLVARGGDIYNTPKWCGSNAFLFKDSFKEVKLVNFVTGKITVIHADLEPLPSGCTPDGKWMLYKKDIQVPPASKDDYDYINAEELYLLEVATGKRKKIARSTDFLPYSAELFSPDGTKFISGPKETLEIVSQDLGFEFVWFSNGDWRVGETAIWFPDSSGIATMDFATIEGVGVEFFSKDVRSQRFELSKGVAYNSSGLRIDRQGRIYFEVLESFLSPYGETPSCPGDTFELPKDISYSINRCVIDGTKLNCEKIVEREGFGGYDILPDGDIVFNEVDQKCIIRVSPKKDNARCFLHTRFGNGEIDYRSIRKIGVSPDGRWLAYVRVEFSSGIRKNDLFVVELNEINKEN